jgi:hypothetical protein
MKKLIILITTISCIGIMLPIDSQAIPAFTRNYGFNCNMCHSGFTKLNDFGQRFRDNGYQIPGQVGKEKCVFETAAPIAMRLSTGLTYYSNDLGSTSTFGLNGFDLLSAGIFQTNISYLVIYTPRIDEPSDSYRGYKNFTSSPSQLAAIESASMVFSNLGKINLKLRIGRFEPAYHIISSKRSYYLFQPYEIYGFMAPINTFNFDDNQFGIEMSGKSKLGCKYTLGVVNGNGASPDNNNNKDFYAVLTHTFGAGDGQSAGLRLGAFGYYGWQPLKCPGDVVGTKGETNGDDNKPFTRFGFNGNFNWKDLSLQMLYMIASDDEALNKEFFEEAYKYNGGFVELDYTGLFNDKLVASAMYNWVKPPDFDPENEISAVSGLLRYYLGDRVAVNTAIHAEYTHRTIGSETKTSEDVIAVALDFAY